MTLALPADASGRLEADRIITADRDELKFLASREHMSALADEIEAALDAHRHTGEGANLLPDPQHFVTTIYFDTPTRRHFRLATRSGEANEKLRAKEYYDLHPCMAELATDPQEVFRYQPYLWFELKRRSGARTSKQRFRLRKPEVPAFFLGAHRNGPDSGGAELEKIAAYCRDLGEPLAASSLVNYQRLSWQDPAGTLRVTMDLDLAFYPVPDDLFVREEPLLRGTLGAPREIEERVVIEVKSRTALPEWLSGALARTGAKPAQFSKFVQAERAVHGDV